jgi:hypothetical protein
MSLPRALNSIAGWFRRETEAVRERALIARHGRVQSGAHESSTKVPPPRHRRGNSKRTGIAALQRPELQEWIVANRRSLRTARSLLLKCS